MDRQGKRLLVGLVITEIVFAFLAGYVIWKNIASKNCDPSSNPALNLVNITISPSFYLKDDLTGIENTSYFPLTVVFIGGSVDFNRNQFTFYKLNFTDIRTIQGQNTSLTGNNYHVNLTDNSAVGGFAFRVSSPNSPEIYGCQFSFIDLNLLYNITINEAVQIESQLNNQGCILKGGSVFNITILGAQFNFADKSCISIYANINGNSRNMTYTNFNPDSI